MLGMEAWFDRLQAKADSRPVCIHCGKVTKEVEHPITKQMTTFRVACPHEAEQGAKEQQAKERKAYYDAWADRYGRLRLPRAFQRLSLDDLDLRACSANGVTAGRKYIATFETWRQVAERWQRDGRRVNGQGLTFIGDVGTGKTSVAYAVAGDLDRLNFTAIAMTEEGIVKAIRAADFDAAAQITQACISCDLLVIDELGDKKQTENAIGEIFSIIHGRHERKNPTIVTTNLDDLGLIQHYSRCLNMSGVGEHDAITRVERMLSRLNQMNVTIEFRGEDQRQQAASWLEDA